MKMKRIGGAALLLAAAVALSACGAAPQADANAVLTPDAAQNGALATSAAQALDAGSADTSEIFSARDLAGTYDAANAVKATLNGDSIDCASDAVKVSGSVATISAAGTYLLSGTLNDGYIIVDAGEEDKVQLVLDGVSVNSSTFAAIYVKQADKVFLTLADGSENSLSNGGTFETIDANKVDGAIFSKDDLTLNGNGKLIVNSPAKHGVVSKDDLTITDGAYEITAASHALSAKDSLGVAGGTLTLSAGKDALHASNDDDAEKGNVYLAGGTIAAAADDDGINASGNILMNGGAATLTVKGDGVHSDKAIAISGGSLSIPACKEGIEAQTIAIADGVISLTASDDGINATSGGSGRGSAFRGRGGFDAETSATVKPSSSATSPAFVSATETAPATSVTPSLTISGGEIYVNSEGDALDANGNLLISGGVIHVSGPTRNGNGALDYDGSGVITGGVLIATGPAGMGQNQNFGTSSTQGAILATVGSQKAGSVITLTDANGKELLRWTAEKDYGCVNLSCPEMEKDGTYILNAGDYSETVTLSGYLYGAGGMGGGRMGRGFDGSAAPFDGTSDARRPFRGTDENGAAPFDGETRRPFKGTGGKGGQRQGVSPEQAQLPDASAQTQSAGMI